MMCVVVVIPASVVPVPCIKPPVPYSIYQVEVPVLSLFQVISSVLAEISFTTYP
jgi:hypothetical protein